MLTPSAGGEAGRLEMGERLTTTVGGCSPAPPFAAGATATSWPIYARHGSARWYHPTLFTATTTVGSAPPPAPRCNKSATLRTEVLAQRRDTPARANANTVAAHRAGRSHATHRLSLVATAATHPKMPVDQRWWSATPTPVATPAGWSGEGRAVVPLRTPLGIAAEGASVRTHKPAHLGSARGPVGEGERVSRSSRSPVGGGGGGCPIESATDGWGNGRQGRNATRRHRRCHRVHRSPPPRMPLPRPHRDPRYAGCWQSSVCRRLGWGTEWRPPAVRKREWPRWGAGGQAGQAAVGVRQWFLAPPAVTGTASSPDVAAGGWPASGGPEAPPPLPPLSCPPPTNSPT